MAFLVIVSHQVLNIAVLNIEALNIEIFQDRRLFTIQMRLCENRIYRRNSFRSLCAWVVDMFNGHGETNEFLIIEAKQTGNLRVRFGDANDVTYIQSIDRNLHAFERLRVGNVSSG